LHRSALSVKDAAKLALACSKDVVQAARVCNVDAAPAGETCSKDAVVMDKACSKDAAPADVACNKGVVQVARVCNVDVTPADEIRSKDAVAVDKACSKDAVQAGETCSKDAVAADTVCSKGVVQVARVCNVDVTPADEIRSKDAVAVDKACSKDAVQAGETCSKDVVPAGETCSKDAVAVDKACSKDAVLAGEICSKDAAAVDQGCSVDVTTIDAITIDATATNATTTNVTTTNATTTNATTTDRRCVVDAAMVGPAGEVGMRTGKGNRVTRSALAASESGPPFIREALRMTLRDIIGTVILCLVSTALVAGESQNYAVVDTGQVRCYDNHTEVTYPKPDDSFSGQDAQYDGKQPSYRDNGDGTITDLVAELMWQADPGVKKTYAQAVAGADKCRTGGHSDWRLPTIKELYSLILFSGIDPDPMGRSNSSHVPFIDTRYFKFEYGKESDGERIIDSQYATSTRYVSTTMGGNATMFGVNFADGRIKGYPTQDRRRRAQKKFCVLYVRGNPDYGKNVFKDNGDETVTDRATGLTWMKADSGKGMNWADALAYARNLELAGHSDWRLPNTKELQSIVDYTRSPDKTGSAAIDPVFDTTAIKNELGQKDYPSYWTGTTHTRAGGRASAAVYVAFGRAMGSMHGRWMDVHGAGCQRSDPKEGNPGDFPKGRGPQGDAIRILNYVRCVRGGVVKARISGPAVRSSSSRSKQANGLRRGLFVQHLDRNGDGKVSKREFDGPSHHFGVLDKDGDGYLVESEAPPPPH
jgi:hypothetical protein